MSKYERRLWFERLVELRTAYHEGSQTVVMTVPEAIAYAERLLDDPEALDTALADEARIDETSNHPTV